MTEGNDLAEEMKRARSSDRPADAKEGLRERSCHVVHASLQQQVVELL
jgi:hypothetical protein